jgi:hypothetical protein
MARGGPAMISARLVQVGQPQPAVPGAIFIPNEPMAAGPGHVIRDRASRSMSAPSADASQNSRAELLAYWIRHWGADADGSGPAGNPRGKAACRSWADATRLAWLPLPSAVLPARQHAAPGPPAEYSWAVLVSRGLHWYCPCLPTSNTRCPARWPARCRQVTLRRGAWTSVRRLVNGNAKMEFEI